MMWTPPPKSIAVLFSMVHPVKEALAPVLTETPAGRDVHSSNFRLNVIPLQDL